MKKTFLWIGVMTTLTLFNFVSQAGAHHVWLNATRYALESVKENPKAKTILYFGWGDYFPAHDFLREGQIQRLFLRSPDGAIQELKTPNAGFNETPIEFTQDGIYVAAASLEPKFVADVWRDGKMEVILKPKDELPQGAEILESKYGLQFAKAIVTVGQPDPKDATFLQPVGHDLEIIPLVNPRTLREGDYFPFKLLFKGEALKAPQADPKIYATYAGFSTGKGVFASTAELSKGGIVRLKLVRYGVWQIHVEYSMPPPSEMAQKADKVEYKASLTFEIP